MIYNQIKKAIQRSTKLSLSDIYLETPEVSEHGDFATNVALIKAQKEKGNPKEIADNIKEKLLKDKDIKKSISKIEVAGPGFINFFLSDESLLCTIDEVLDKKGKFGSSDAGKGKKVIVDYSSPNITKRFSIGHLRSTIIGQALRNLYDFQGYETIGDNHLGDWGTQFGMIIAQVVDKGLDSKKLTINDYQKLYIEFNEEMKTDPDLRNIAMSWFKKLEDGDERARSIWKDAVDQSMKEFDRIYEILGVGIENAYGESFYEDKMPKVIDELRKKGLLKKSEGAEIVEFKDMTPAIILKSDGGTTYYTRDLACVKFRLDEYSPSIIIYEVGVEQRLHFKQVFETANMLGWTKDEKLIHVYHGHFRLKGKKMSSRKGNDVILEDVLNESIRRAREMIDKIKTRKDLKEAEKDKLSKMVGVGAIKYFDLMHQPKSDIDFNWENVFTMQGNSGPYLQYTYARAKSVLRKAGVNDLKIEKEDTKFDESEKVLMRTFPQFQGVTIGASKSYSPNLLCNYLFELAQKYNTFYNQNKIIGSENEDLRLALTTSTAQIIKNGLSLLGIDAPEKM